MRAITVLSRPTLVFLALLISSLSTYAQNMYFSLTSEGFKSRDGKDFVVLQYAEKPADVLYQNVLLALHNFLPAPKDALSTIENKSITMNVFVPEVIDVRGSTKFDLEYSLNLQFKDNKVRVNAMNVLYIGNQPSLESLRTVSINPSGNAWRTVYNQNGHVRFDNTRVSLDEFFNSLVDRIKLSAEKGLDDMEW